MNPQRALEELLRWYLPPFHVKISEFSDMDFFSLQARYLGHYSLYHQLPQHQRGWMKE